MAMGIFLLGMVFVAALFPAAALVQKETIDDTNAEQAVRTVRALLGGMKYQVVELTPPSASCLVEPDPVTAALVDTSGVVHRFESVFLPGDTNQKNPIVGGWSLRDRCLPSSVTDVAIGNMYWVPLVRDANVAPDQHEWQVFAFVLKRKANAIYFSRNNSNLDPQPTEPQATYFSANPNDLYIDQGTADSKDDYWRVPNVGRIEVTIPLNTVNRFDFENGTTNSFELNDGDWLLDSNGVVYRVLTADIDGVTIDGFINQANKPTHIWYAPPGNGGVSPCKQIIILTDAVQP